MNKKAKVTNNGEVYGGKYDQQEGNKPTEDDVITQVTTSGEPYKTKKSEDDIRNTEAYKQARTKYDTEEYADLTDQEKDQLTLRDLEQQNGNS